MATDSSTATIEVLVEKRHAERMADPIYAEGFNGPNHWVKPWPENPYPFDTKTSLELTRIATIERALTPEEIKELVRLRELLDSTPWSRWAAGNYYRWCVKKA